MWFEFGHYMVGVGKVLVFLLSLMKEHVLYYVYLFFERVEKLVQAYILGSKKLPSIVENLVSTFAKDWQFYKNEICLEALAKNLEPIICNGMVCLNIFKGGVVTYVHLVCISIFLNFVHSAFYLFSNWYNHFWFKMLEKNVHLWRLSLMILMEIVVNSLLLCVFKSFLVFPWNMLQLVGMSKSSAPQKTCKMLTSMLVMEKAQEGTKGKTIHRPWLWMKFLLLHHQLIMADWVMSKGKKYL